MRDVLLDGFNARLFEHLWCVKIRFPEGEGDDVNTGLLQFGGLSGHRNGRGFREAVEQLRGALFHGNCWGLKWKAQKYSACSQGCQHGAINHRFFVNSQSPKNVSNPLTGKRAKPKLNP